MDMIKVIIEYFIIFLIKHFKGLRNKFSTHERVKKIARILFIDDEKFQIINNLELNGYDVKYLKDITSNEETQVKKANILFIDYDGVGKSFSEDKQGLSLVENLKKTYPKKRIILYSGQLIPPQNAITSADRVIDKTSDLSEFIEVIQEETKLI